MGLRDLSRVLPDTSTLCQGGNFGLLESRLPLSLPFGPGWNHYGLGLYFPHARVTIVGLQAGKVAMWDKNNGTPVFSPWFCHCPGFTALS